MHRTFPGPVTSLRPQHCAFWCQSFLVLKDVTLCILTQILPHAKSYRISNFTFCCCLADGAHPHMSAKGLNTKEPRNEPNWGWWGGRVEDKTASDLLHSLTCSPLAERMLLLSELNPSVRTSLRWPFLWMLEVSKHLTLCASTSCTSAISTVLLLRSAATWHGNQQQTHFQKERKKRIRYSMNLIVWITKWKVMTTPHPPTPPLSTRIRTCHTNWLKQSSTMKHSSNTNLRKYEMECVNCNAFYFLNHVC